jgi:hypothetical protein
MLWLPVSRAGICYGQAATAMTGDLWVGQGVLAGMDA